MGYQDITGRLNAALGMAGVMGGITQRDRRWIYSANGCEWGFSEGMKVDYQGEPV